LEILKKVKWPSDMGLHIYKYKEHYIQKPSKAYDLWEAKKFQELDKHLKTLYRF
jgi:hypothetical protein